jgi:hypothetical protein
MRIQVEFPAAKVADAKWLMEAGQARTYYDLFNNALSLLKWATDEVINGRAIVSLCEETGNTRHLVTPFLQEAAKKAKQKTESPTQKKEAGKQLSSSTSAS